MRETTPTLAIIGAGRVGSALAQGLARRGYRVAAVYSRTEASARQLADKVSAGVAATSGEAARAAQLAFLTVPDDWLARVCDELASQPDLALDRHAVVHTSGAAEVAVLDSARRRGAWIGGLHPLLPVMDTDLPPAFAGHSDSPHITFGVEADSEPLRGWLADIVQVLNGTPIWLRPGQDRARYHAAGAIASNYTVTLFAEAVALLQGLGNVPLDEATARRALIGLVDATVQNIRARGATQALTGPISRGDAGTVRRHLAALDQSDPELAEIYRLLGRRTLRIAAERGLSADLLAALSETLTEHSTEPSDLP